MKAETSNNPIFTNLFNLPITHCIQGSRLVFYDLLSFYLKNIARYKNLLLKSKQKIFQTTLH